MASPGDRVHLSGKKPYEGVLMPSTDEDILILKLDNGYNIGVEKKHIKNIRVVKKYSPSEQKKKTVKKRKNLPTISILHTGGTIASKVDYETGGVIARFTPEELLAQFPEIEQMANIKSRLISNMWSEDMRFSHYNIMAKEIKKEIDQGAEGIIITHGTDTLHYSSAALSFILDGLKTPVLLVGSQRSSDRGSSDAGMNLLCALKFIKETDFGEVAICMHAHSSDDVCHILPATKARKMHTSRRDAFRPINEEVWAHVPYQEKPVTFLREDYQKKGKDALDLKPFDPDIKVGILKAHPNMFADEVRAYHDYDGLVLEGTGLGQMPISRIDKHTQEHEHIWKALKKLSKNTVLAMSPQTIHGRIDMNVYAPARKLQPFITGNYSDMTPETTYIKLSWLLSNYEKEKVPDMMMQNLRGELNERLTKDMF